MNHQDLDTLLRDDERAWDDSVDDAVTGMIFASKIEAARAVAARRRMPRRAVIAGAIVAGVVVLTAGAGVTAAQLGIPPFQTIEVGTERVATPVPITYTEADGTPVRCKAFMEFRNLDNAGQARIVSAITTHDWTGVGQVAYDGAHARGGTVENISFSFGEKINDSLFAEARAVLPDLIRGPSATTGVIFNGYGMSCSAQNHW